MLFRSREEERGGEERTGEDRRGITKIKRERNRISRAEKKTTEKHF